MKIISLFNNSYNYNSILLSRTLLCLLPFSIILGNGVINLNILLLIIFSCLNFKRTFLNKKLKYIIIIGSVWFFYLIFSSLISNYPINSLKSSIPYVRFPLLSISIFILCKLDHKIIKYFLGSLFTSFILIILYSYFQKFFGFNLFGDIVTHRLYLFKDEEILGSYLSRFLPLLVGLYLYVRKKILLYDYIILAFFFIVTGSAVILSGERTALFIFLMILIFFIIFIKDRIKNKIIIFLPLIFLASIIFSVDSIREAMIEKTFDQMFIKHTDKIHAEKTNFNYLLNNKNIDIFSLEHEWHYIAALKIIKNNYLFGVGQKNFRIECLDKIYNIENGCSTHPHNVSLQLLSEVGLIGAIPILILFLYICYLFIKSFFMKINLEKINIFNFRNLLFLSIFISLLPVIPSGNFFGTWLSVIAFIPLGFILWTINNDKR